jgi:DNA mismatch repair ATPase MutL
MVGLKPMAFLCFELPAGSFDVNVTPDKRSVFIQKEVAIMNALGQVRSLLIKSSSISLLN